MIDLSANLPSDTPIEPVKNKGKARRDEFKKNRPRSKLIELADDQIKKCNDLMKSVGKNESKTLM